MSVEDLVDDKELVVVMTQAQYIKTMPAASFRTQTRGGRGVKAATLKEDDIVRRVMFTTAHAHLLFFSNKGKVYKLRAMEIPERERSAKGVPIVNLLPLVPGETIQAIVDTRELAGQRYLFFVTTKGNVKKTAFDAYNSSRRDGLIALNLKAGDELVRVIETSGSEDIFIISRSGQVIRFAEKEVRPMGRTAAGVRGMKLKTGDAVVSADSGKASDSLLIVTDAGYAKRTEVKQYPRKGRGTQGVIGVKITNKKGKVAGAFMVGKDDEIVAVASNGVTIRTAVSEISLQGRVATGVRLMSLDRGATVASVAPILSTDEE
jgi:DNA gyrase subunit A